MALGWLLPLRSIRSLVQWKKQPLGNFISLGKDGGVSGQCQKGGGNLLAFLFFKGKESPEFGSLRAFLRSPVSSSFTWGKNWA